MLSVVTAAVLGLAIGAALGAHRIDGGAWPVGLALGAGALIGAAMHIAWQASRRREQTAIVADPMRSELPLDAPAPDTIELRSEFLSTVAHELRTPLTSVKGSLQLVLGKAGGLRAIDRELLSISLKNADRLIRLINNLLDISRLELGKVDLARTPVEPRGMIEEAVAGLRTYAEERGVTLASACDADVPIVRVDHDRVMQVLTNLISNAVKFSPTGAEVRVEVRRAGDALAIAVVDRGCGISASDQLRLFRRFQRLESTRSTEAGTGLGLAISKAIVDRHGGSIIVESAEGSGSIFTVRLPFGEIGGPPEDDASQVPTLLLVGGDSAVRATVATATDRWCHVVLAPRGVDALAHVRRAQPSAIVLVGNLPDLGTEEVLAILQHGGARDTPVVLLATGEARTFAGVSEVVTMPIEGARLEAVIRRWLPDARLADTARSA